MILLMPILRLIFEILLLVVMLYVGIRELATLAIVLIVLRLILSSISRILQIPYVLDEFDQIAWGIIICVLKIVLEVGIFFSLKEDISISTDFVGIIIILMILRNASEAWSLLAIEFDE